MNGTIGAKLRRLWLVQVRDVQNPMKLRDNLRKIFRVRTWMPVALMSILILILGAYTANQSPRFLSDYNLNNILLATLPLALVAMAQVNAILVGYLDISVGSVMTIGVVIASFIVTGTATPGTIILGGLAMLGTGIVVGLFNAGLVRGLSLPSIIATLATLNILNGIALTLRPVAAGPINYDVVTLLTTSVGFVPVAFVGILILAAVWDLWLFRSAGGLTLRAIGHDKRASRRIGAATTRIRVGALVVSGLMAAVASIFLAAKVQIGDPRSGDSFALTSITAAVLGGASLAGGRGSFIGAVVAALFLALLSNVLPFLGLTTEVGLIATGILMLIGVLVYNAEELRALVEQNYKQLERRVTRARPARQYVFPDVSTGDVTVVDSNRKLLKGGTVLTIDPTLGNFAQADVLIDGARIVAVGPNLDGENAEIIDASKMIVMPGFIDTHRHIWEGILRNIGTDIPLEGGKSYLAFILGTLAPVFRPEDAYIGNLVSALGALDAGITTLLDWSHIQSSPDHTDAVVQALQVSGMRAVFAYGFPWYGKWNKRQPSWFVRASKEYFTSKDQLLTLALAAPGPEFVDFEIARDHWKLARQVGARISVHVGTGTYGQEGKLREMGEAGLLRDDTTYIHCTTLSDTEIQMIVDTGGTVSLASPVEMMMGHGMPPIQKFLDRGLRPSLSVDVETNMPGDMFTQMRTIHSLQRAIHFQKALAGEKNLPRLFTSHEVLELATIEGARANGLDHKVGSLTPGKEADIIMLRTDRVNVMPINDPVGAVVWGMDTGNVDSVFVAGKPMKRHGELVGVDINCVRKLAYKSRDYVVNKSGFKLPKI